MFILAFGHLVNAATGLPGLLLNMSGYSAIEFRILLAVISGATLVALVAGATLGGPGIAAAFSAAIIFKNLFSFIAVKRIFRDPSRISLAPTSITT